jgi:uncharacterized membrane protein
MSSSESKLAQSNRGSPLIAAGIWIGLGLGGFFDGILLHEILQWHHMLSSIRPITTLANLKANTLWDGYFHAATWTMTGIGIALLWRAGGQSGVPWSSKVFGGSILLGAGIFNLVEGIVDHQILGVHHVKSGPNQLAWDMGFLLLGVVLIGVGWTLVQSGQKESSLQP